MQMGSSSCKRKDFTEELTREKSAYKTHGINAYVVNKETDLEYKFVEKARRILPVHGKIKIGIDRSGYIFFKKELKKPIYARTVDMLGRDIFLLGEILVFRRYVKGFNMTTGRIGIEFQSYVNPITKEKIQELNNILDNFEKTQKK